MKFPRKKTVLLCHSDCDLVAKEYSTKISTPSKQNELHLNFYIIISTHKIISK